MPYMTSAKRHRVLSVSLAAALFGVIPSLAGEIRFRDAAEAWGVDFRHHHGGSGERYMVETMVGGLTAFDFDSDGDPDLFFVDGGELPGYTGEAPATRLYRNDGGRFVDVSEASGVRAALAGPYGCGVVAGDIDDDGDLDLFVTAFGPDRLLLNDGEGRFTDGTTNAHLGEPAWSAGAAFVDVDGDQDLDLYVAGYVDFSLENHKFCGDKAKGIRAYCQPGEFRPLPDHLYLNDGRGRFTDATRAAGLAVAPGAGLGVLAGDLDGDGKPDLYIANDETPNFLFRNRGQGTGGVVSFEDVSLLSGTAYSDRGRPEAGMGVDLADFDGDGRSDLVVTNFEFETNALYLNVGNGLFNDVRWVSGFAEPTLTKLAFGVAFADFDHDRDLDLAIANGHILDNATELNPQSRYRQRNQVFENVGGARYREIQQVGLDIVRASRGLVAADLDGDGDLDLAINNSDDLAEVYENVGTGGGWLQVAPRSAAGNRHGIGARVDVEVDDQTQSREVRAGSSYLSQNELTVHFGLGDPRKIDRVTVRWPSGAVWTIVDVPPDRRLRAYKG